MTKKGPEKAPTFQASGKDTVEEQSSISLAVAGRRGELFL